MFDPFYTTRQGSGGTGLGLSIAHSVVTDHGGTIEVVGRPDKGTAFTVHLPLDETSNFPRDNTSRKEDAADGQNPDR